MPDRPLTLEALDVQAQPPSHALGLSRVGVTGVEKVIRIRQHGVEQLFWGRLECFVDLGPDQKGAHMSRFEEVVNDAIGEVVLGESTFKAETLAERIAELVRARQQARRAEVSIEARFPEHKPAPVSGIQTQELYTLHGSAACTALGTRRHNLVYLDDLTAGWEPAGLRLSFTLPAGSYATVLLREVMKAAVDEAEEPADDGDEQ